MRAYKSLMTLSYEPGC